MKTSDNRLIHKKIIYIRKDYPKHKWRLTENGEIDTSAFCDDIHEGPECVQCGYFFCIHCNQDGFNKRPCIKEEHRCPNPDCNCEVDVYSHPKYCSECGQAFLI